MSPGAHSHCSILTRCTYGPPPRPRFTSYWRGVAGGRRANGMGLPSTGINPAGLGALLPLPRRALNRRSMRATASPCQSPRLRCTRGPCCRCCRPSLRCALGKLRGFLGLAQTTGTPHSLAFSSKALCTPLKLAWCILCRNWSSLMG